MPVARGCGRPERNPIAPPDHSPYRRAPLAGSTVVRVGPFVLDLILPPDVPRWIWWTARILVIVPLYQVLLLAYGTILGQFSFFWEKEKAMVRWMGRPFTRSS